LLLKFIQGEEFTYEIRRKGDAPRPCYGAFSAIYEDKLFVFGGITEKNDQLHQDYEKIYSLNLGMLKIVYN